MEVITNWSLATRVSNIEKKRDGIGGGDVGQLYPNRYKNRLFSEEIQTTMNKSINIRANHGKSPK